MDDNALNIIRVMLREEIDPLTQKVASLESTVHAQQEIAKEHGVVPRLREVEKFQETIKRLPFLTDNNCTRLNAVEKNLAHLTGKILGFSALASVLVGILIKLMEATAKISH